VSPSGGDDRGLPRRQGRIPIPRHAPKPEEWSGANAAKGEKLRRTSLKRDARARGLELRHTAYGYALVDAERNRVDDRNDMTLDEVASWLARS